MSRVCAICGKPRDEVTAMKTHPVWATLMHNYRHGGLLFSRRESFYLGVILEDGRFICVDCEEVTRLFEDYFDAFDYILYETSFIRTLVNWVRLHLEVIPADLRRGSYLPKAQCEQALRGAGIELSNARVDVEEAWRRRWS